MTSLLILLAFPERVRMRYYERLRSAFPQLAVSMVDHKSKVDPYIAETDILLTFGPMLRDDSVVARAKKLKWIQAMGSGVDGIADLPSLRREVILTNIQGIHGASVAEGALMGMLALARRLPQSLRNQERRHWQRWPVGILDGKTVGIFGLGLIAEALAPRCKAFAMRVVGITSAKRDLPGFDRVFGRDELVEAVRDLDFLVLLTPYSPATRHIVGAAVFAAMKPTAHLVNLARGGVVDEAALIAALARGQIAGAALDVFSTEPLPEDNPLWSMPNVIVTPHLGGFYDEYPERALPVVEENLKRFLAGDYAHMINIVRRST